MLWLLEQLESVRPSNVGDEEEKANFEERKSELQQLLETDEEALDAIYKWYVLKCPRTEKREGNDPYAGLKVAVKKLWGGRVNPFYWQDALMSLLCRPILYLLKCFARLRKGRSSIFCCRSSPKKPSLMALLKTSHRKQQEEPQAGIDQEQPQEAVDKFDYEFVWFNAWLYSGSSTLWAGLIMELYKATENHFGNDYANAQIKAKFYKALLHGIVTGALLGLSIFLATFNVEYEVVSFSQVVAPVISGIARNYRIVSPCSLQN